MRIQQRIWNLPPATENYAAVDRFDPTGTAEWRRGEEKANNKKKESTLANTISALRQLSYFCWMPTMSSVARSFFSHSEYAKFIVIIFKCWKLVHFEDEERGCGSHWKYIKSAYAYHCRKFRWNFSVRNIQKIRNCNANANERREKKIDFIICLDFHVEFHFIFNF